MEERIVIPNEFWEKKIKVSYFLSVFVFLIHISTLSNYEISHSSVKALEVGLPNVLTRIAVPLFFVLSGFSFFINYENKSFKKKLKRRIKSLLIPYLLWNLIWLIFSIVTSYTIISNYFIGRDKFVISPQSIFLAIFHYSENIPFWFVFDLICFVIISPLINILLRNKYVGLLIIIMIWVLLIFNIGLPVIIFYSKESILYYMLGAFISKHYSNFFIYKSLKNSKYWVTLLISCLIVDIIKCANSFNFPIWLNIIFLFVYSVAFWKAMDVIVFKIPCSPFFNRSFMVYAMHVNVSAVITKLILFVLPKNDAMAVLNLILTIIITLGFINYFCVILKKLCPPIYSVLSGDRSNYSQVTGKTTEKVVSFNHN